MRAICFLMLTLGCPAFVAAAFLEMAAVRIESEPLALASEELLVLSLGSLAFALFLVVATVFTNLVRAVLGRMAGARPPF